MDILYSGDYDKAKEIYAITIKQAKAIGNKREMGNSYNGIGAIYHEKGDYYIALEYHTRSLEIFEEIGDKYGMAGSLTSIGIEYDFKGDFI